MSSGGTGSENIGGCSRRGGMRGTGRLQKDMLQEERVMKRKSLLCDYTGM